MGPSLSMTTAKSRTMQLFTIRSDDKSKARNRVRLFFFYLLNPLNSMTILPTQFLYAREAP